MKLMVRKCIEYLKEHGDSNTTKLVQYCNEQTSHGTSAVSLTGMFQHIKVIKSVGKEKVKSAGQYRGSYDITVWSLQEDRI